MMKNLTLNGEALDASLEGILAIVQFLNTNYQFRFNQLNGKVEFVNLKSAPTEWRDLTDPAINSIILKARMFSRELIFKVIPGLNRLILFVL